MPAPPSKYTPDRLARFAQALRMGATYALACKYAGFSYSRYREWMVDAEQNPETSMYRELPALVAEAESDCAVRMLAQVQKAAPDDWRAAAWVLERRYEEYAKKSSFEAAVEHRLSADTIRQMASEEARRMGGTELPVLDVEEIRALEAANRDPDG